MQQGGWFDPDYPHGSQDFSLQLENSGVMKTLWDHMGSVVKTDSFLIPTVLFLLHFNMCRLRCRLDRKHGGCQADIGIRALVLINWQAIEDYWENFRDLHRHDEQVMSISKWFSSLADISTSQFLHVERCDKLLWCPTLALPKAKDSAKWRSLNELW